MTDLLLMEPYEAMMIMHNLNDFAILLFSLISRFAHEFQSGNTG